VDEVEMMIALPDSGDLILNGVIALKNVRPCFTVYPLE